MTRRKSPGRRSPAEWGTVEQLPSGRWRAFYRRDGKKFSAPRTFPTKAEGQGWLAMENADRARGVWRDPADGKVSLDAFARAWLDARPDLRPRTVDLYRRALDRWVLPPVGGAETRGVELGEMDIAAITPAVVRAWYAAVRSQAAASASQRRPKSRVHPARQWALEAGHQIGATGRISPKVLEAWKDAGCAVPGVLPAPATAGQTAASQAYRLLRAILATATSDGVIPANPCRIKNAGNAAHRERSVASLADITSLSRSMPPHLSAAVTVAAWSGLRYGELFGLARRHVTEDGVSLRVERALENVPGRPMTFGQTKTANSRRTVHLPATAASALARHMRVHTAHGSDALIFSTDTGQAISNAALSRAFRRARERVGRTDLTWHDLRHTGATLAYAAGASVPEVQRRLGHNTMRAAQLYAHSVADADRLLAERLDRLTTESEA